MNWLGRFLETYPTNSRGPGGGVCDHHAVDKLHAVTVNIKQMQPGDFIILTTDRALSMQQRHGLQDSFKELGLPDGVKVAVLDHGMGFNIVRPPAANAASDVMTNALKKAANQFRHYALLHSQKNPPDADKARTNAMMAQVCEYAIEGKEHSYDPDQ